MIYLALLYSYPDTLGPSHPYRPPDYDAQRQSDPRAGPLSYQHPDANTSLQDSGLLKFEPAPDAPLVPDHHTNGSLFPQQRKYSGARTVFHMLTCTLRFSSTHPASQSSLPIDLISTSYPTIIKSIRNCTHPPITPQETPRHR